MTMMGRRPFLMALAASLFLPAAAGIRRPDLARLLGWPADSARAVGRAYLATAPAEAALAAEALGPLLAARPLWPVLRRRIGEDFTSGDTVMVDGWVLARTEARLCALCALTGAA